MSSILYILYTNEVPAIHKLIEDTEWTEKNLEETGTKFTDNEHNTVNFIDDSNSMISFADPTEANKYIERFFSILKIYYNDMKLKMNSDKTSLLIISKPNLDKYKNDEEEVIKPKPQIKLLGWTMNERSKQDSNLNIVIGSITRILINLKPIEKYMNVKARTTVASNKMMSRLSYGLPM